jgi:putative copper resistance protein D
VTTVAALSKFVHLALAAFFLGSLVFHSLIAGPALRAAGAASAAEFTAVGRRQAALAGWTLLGIFFSGLLAFWQQIVSVAGLSPVQSLTLEIIGGVLLGTRSGVVWLIRSALILFLAAMIYGRRAERLIDRPAPILLPAAALIMAPAFASHAAAGERIWLAAQLTADALHLLAAGVWLGGLPAFALFLARSVRLNEPWGAVAFKETTRRFSFLGCVCVAVVLATGIFNAWTLVGAVAPLMGTSYGKLLLGKIVLLLPLLAVASASSTGLTVTAFAPSPTMTFK